MLACTIYTAGDLRKGDERSGRNPKKPTKWASQLGFQGQTFPLPDFIVVCLSFRSTIDVMEYVIGCPLFVFRWLTRRFGPSNKEIYLSYKTKRALSCAVFPSFGFPKPR